METWLERDGVLGRKSVSCAKIDSQTKKGQTGCMQMSLQALP